MTSGGLGRLASFRSNTGRPGATRSAQRGTGASTVHRLLRTVLAVLVIAAPLSGAIIATTAAQATAAPNNSGGISQYYAILPLESVSDLLFNQDAISPD